MSAPTALITGAGTGIGLALTRCHAEAGWTVLAHCRGPAPDSELADLAARHNRIEIITADLARVDDIAALAAQVRDRPLDRLINNAGTYGKEFESMKDSLRAQSLGTLDYENIELCLQVNCLAPLRLTEMLSSSLEATDAPRVANITSTMGSTALIPTTMGGGGLYAYRISKAALNNATATLANDLAARGIVVLLIHPGVVRTQMGAPNATLSAEDSARAIMQRIDESGPDSAGKFLSFNGDVLPW